MKKNKIFLSGICILLALTLFSVSGCKKFLERKPLTATLNDLNQGGVEGQIFGLYSAIKDYDIGQVFGGIPWQAMHNFRSDDSEKGSDAADGAEWVAPFDNFAYVKDLWASNYYWEAHYRFIHLTNTAIQTADSLKLTSLNDNVNVAEARFFRAFAYFDLVRVYGEVPKIDFRLYTPAQANIAKSPVTGIFALIDADLQFAAQNLPPSWGSQYPGRLTSGAAKSLLAKAHMFRGNYAQALPLLQQVIASNTYSLYPSYFGVFKDAGENSSESILEWQNYMGPNQTDDRGSWYATCQGVRASGASGWNLGWGWNTPTDAFVNSFEAGDVRKASSVLFSGQSDDPATGGYGGVLPGSIFDVPAGPLPRKYWNKKVYADPAVRKSTGWLDGAYWINQRVIRYADVLLSAAECMNETGAGATGITQLNKVRARVGLPELTFTNQSQFRTDIKKERRAELGLEGERFFDLVRWGDAQAVLGSLGYQARCRYYPIPQPAIDLSNGTLVQNPLW